jgi:quinol monooxygenase YgiN
MSDSVFFVVELEVKPGQVDELQSVMEEMAAVTQADEPGTLNYEWFLTDDGSACYIFERYADAEAGVVHSRTFPPELSQRAMAFRPTRLTAYGSLSEAIRQQRESSQFWRRFLGSASSRSSQVAASHGMSAPR